MLIELFILFIACLFSVLITLFCVPVGYGYHYFAPILLLIAGYIVGLGMAWVILYLCSLRYDRNKIYDKPSKMATFLLRESISYIVHHALVKVKVVGDVVIPNERFMIISNHRSKFDPMILVQKFGKRTVAFISKPTNFKIPIGARFMAGACYLSIDRYDKLKSLDVMKRATALIADDYTSIGVFPEGTRSETNELGLFHEGVFSIAAKANCPIIVTSFMGTEKIHKNFPLKRTVVTLNMLEVLYPNDYADMTPKAISDHCYEVIKNSLTDL